MDSFSIFHYVKRHDSVGDRFILLHIIGERRAVELEPARVPATATILLEEPTPGIGFVARWRWVPVVFRKRKGTGASRGGRRGSAPLHGLHDALLVRPGEDDGLRHVGHRHAVCVCVGAVPVYRGSEAYPAGS